MGDKEIEELFTTDKHYAMDAFTLVMIPVAEKYGLSRYKYCKLLKERIDKDFMPEFEDEYENAFESLYFLMGVICSPEDIDKHDFIDAVYKNMEANY